MGMSSVMSMGFSVRWGQRVPWPPAQEMEKNDSVFLAEFQGGPRRALCTELVLRPLAFI